MSVNFTTKDQKRMLDLRNQGYSNKAISIKLGVPYKTVLQAIGKQPTSLPAEPRIDESMPPKPDTDVLCEESITLTGKIARYEILNGIGVAITIRGVNIELLYWEELSAFIRELEQIESRSNWKGDIA